MAHDPSDALNPLPYPRSPARSYGSSASPPGLYTPLPPIQQQQRPHHQGHHQQQQQQQHPPPPPSHHHQLHHSHHLADAGPRNMGAYGMAHSTYPPSNHAAVRQWPPPPPPPYQHSDRVPERGITDRMSERMSERMPDRMADRMADRMPDHMPDRMADRLSERMPPMMSHDTSSFSPIGGGAGRHGHDSRQDLHQDLRQDERQDPRADLRYGPLGGIPRPPSAPSHSSGGLGGGGGGGALGKRAYRQRRKDPSCDACRERKVKCDATESMSCSECTSRNVKCQFTKDTNRRMSSMKQVQDLMNQTTELKNENAILHQQLRDKGRVVLRAPAPAVTFPSPSNPNPNPTEMDIDHEPESVSHGGSDAGVSGGQWEDEVLLLRAPLAGVNAPPPPSSRRKRTVAAAGLEGSEFAQRFAGGVWRRPRAGESGGGASAANGDRCPDGEEAGRKPLTQALGQTLLAAYRQAVYVYFPVVETERARELVERVCRDEDGDKDDNKDFVDPPQRSLAYALLAAGALFGGSNTTRFRRSAELLDRARALVDPWDDEPTLEKVQTLALVAFCLGEMNLVAAAWGAVGKAARAAAEIELHLEEDATAEARRRAWWSIYVLERTLAAELGRRSAIDDDDCDVALPAAEGLEVPGSGASSETQPPAHLLPFLHMVDTARVCGPLSRAVAAPPVRARLAATLDQRLDDAAAYFSAGVPEYSLLPAPTVVAHMHALSARLLVHRHALAAAPAHAPDVRMAAAQQCFKVASTTAKLLVRLAAPAAPAPPLDGAPGATPDADAPTATGPPPAHAVLHMFRCAAVLIWAGSGKAATHVVRELARVGDARDVAVPCGRFLEAWVAVVARRRAELATRIAQGGGPGSGVGPGGPAAPTSPPLEVVLDEPAAGRLQAALLQDEELGALVAGGLAEGGALASSREASSKESSTDRMYSPLARLGMDAGAAAEWAVAGPGWKRLEAGVRAFDEEGVRMMPGSWGGRAVPATTHSSASSAAMAGGTPPLTMSLPPDGAVHARYERAGSGELAAAAAAAAASALPKARSQMMSIANII